MFTSNFNGPRNQLGEQHNFALIIDRTESSTNKFHIMRQSVRGYERLRCSKLGNQTAPPHPQMNKSMFAIWLKCGILMSSLRRLPTGSVDVVLLWLKLGCQMH